MPHFLLLGVATALLISGCHRPTSIQEIRATEGSVSNVEILSNDDQWPWWRGLRQDNKSRDENPPTQWSETDHIVWRAAVPGRGHASPIVTQDQVILLTSDEDAQEQAILSYDRDTGVERWRTTVHHGGFAQMHAKNTQASSTPAWDGKRLFAAFVNSDALWLTAIDTQGNIVWQRAAGPFASEHGYGSAPVLYKSLVIVCGDNTENSFLAAMDRASGEIVWRTARERPGRHGSYATPIVVKVAGKQQLLLAGHGKITSYDPETGESIWFCDGPAEVIACTVACSDEIVFATGGYPEKEIIAIRGDGSGNVTATHVVWRSRKGVAYVPSPVYHDGHLYVVNDEGVASCFEAATGNVKWKERLAGGFSASPVFANGKLFACSEDGTTFVFNAEPKFELIAENQLGSGYFASPAICGGRIYLRTTDELCCISL